MKDAQGNVLAATDATWSSAGTGVATVRVDTVLTIPGAAFSRAFIVAVDSGSTTVSVTVRGQTGSVGVRVNR